MRFLFVCAALSAVALSQAAVLFADDFESGTLSQWSPGSSAQIVADPLASGHGNVVNFTRLGSGGDLFESGTISTPATGTYTLSFDYLGTPVSGLTTGNGGFLGTDDLTGEHWYFGTGGYPYSVQLIDDNTWHHYSIVLPNSDTLRIKLEDYVGSGGVAGDAYFDNIRVSSVPGPESMAVFGIAALGARRRRRK